MDRTYVGFEHPRVFELSAAFFVVRASKGGRLRRRYSHRVPPGSGVLSDQTLVLDAAASAKRYPAALRRVRCHDAGTDQTLVFLTSNFDLPALTIALLYPSRWKVELFFQWTKQHLRLKTCFGAGDNAVKTQIWIAISLYVLVAILEKRLQLEPGLHQILPVLSVTLFEKVPTPRAFDDAESQEKWGGISNQSNLFDL